jgi:hypothetical protein
MYSNFLTRIFCLPSGRRRSSAEVQALCRLNPTPEPVLSMCGYSSGQFRATARREGKWSLYTKPVEADIPVQSISVSIFILDVLQSM